MSKQKFRYKSVLILLLVLQQTCIYSIEGSVSKENNDIYKVKDSTRHHLSDFFSLEYKFGHRTLSSIKDRSPDNTVTISSNYKKWQVGRVSRKQYEIINMLWRKTKKYGDGEKTTVKFYTSDPLYIIPSRPKPISTTSSFIEFYYLDEDSNPKHQFFNEQRSPILEKLDKTKRGTADNPNLAFHSHNPNLPDKHIHSKHTLKMKVQTRPSLLTNSLHKYLTLPIPIQSRSYKTTLINKISTVGNYETCPITTERMHTDAFIRKEQSNIVKLQSTTTRPDATTLYDRIKFFETYDKGTPLPSNAEKPINLNDVEIAIHGNKINADYNVMLENGTQYNRNNRSHKSKKHIIDSNKSNNLNSNFENINLTSDVNSTTAAISPQNGSYWSVTETLLKTTQTTKFAIHNVSSVVNWSDYSFMAVYVYEPWHVYCDAAGVSPHWLITSGSCLSRRHNNPRGEGRSAFVAYCGSSWWSPERVVYVKYSVIHPRYRERDKLRLNMYNIGLIQVENSMATCPGWAPVNLMSHQFVADAVGSKAFAVGWGLDRYDVRDTAADLPKYPLMIYESRVFSNSCPGLSNNTELKYSNALDDMRNLYCLLLPPYSGEDNDPIHGSMLLIEGKLCAIYLQEERRSYGEQSAQYTGIWRLGPWVTDVARETEDFDTFSFAK